MWEGKNFLFSNVTSLPSRFQMAERRANTHVVNESPNEITGNKTLLVKAKLGHNHDNRTPLGLICPAPTCRTEQSPVRPPKTIKQMHGFKYLFNLPNDIFYAHYILTFYYLILKHTLLNLLYNATDCRDPGEYKMK